MLFRVLHNGLQLSVSRVISSGVPQSFHRIVVVAGSPIGTARSPCRAQNQWSRSSKEQFVLDMCVSAARSQESGVRNSEQDKLWTLRATIPARDQPDGRQGVQA